MWTRLGVWLACSVIIGLLACPALALDAVVSWDNPVDILNPIRIEKASSPTGTWAFIFQTAPNATTWTNTGVAPGATVCYRAQYINSAGGGPYSASACKTFPALPTTAPANLQVN